jgi:hypothetical protein
MSSVTFDVVEDMMWRGGACGPHSDGATLDALVRELHGTEAMKESLLALFAERKDKIVEIPDRNEPSNPSGVRYALREHPDVGPAQMPQLVSDLKAVLASRHATTPGSAMFTEDIRKGYNAQKGIEMRGRGKKADPDRINAAFEYVMQENPQVFGRTISGRQCPFLVFAKEAFKRRFHLLEAAAASVTTGSGLFALSGEKRDREIAEKDSKDDGSGKISVEAKKARVSVQAAGLFDACMRLATIHGEASSVLRKLGKEAEAKLATIHPGSSISWTIKDYLRSETTPLADVVTVVQGALEGIVVPNCILTIAPDGVVTAQWKTHKL